VKSGGTILNQRLRSGVKQGVLKIALVFADFEGESRPQGWPDVLLVFIGKVGIELRRTLRVSKTAVKQSIISVMRKTSQDLSIIFLTLTRKYKVIYIYTPLFGGEVLTYQ
jgi:hypothetical protein